jgi:hypothetical protein
MAQVHMRSRRSGEDLRQIAPAAAAALREDAVVVNGTTMEFGRTVADALAFLNRARKVEIWVKVDHQDSVLFPYSKRSAAAFLKGRSVNDPMPSILFTYDEGADLGIGCSSALHRVTGQRV